MARVTRMTKRRLGELLRAEGLITEDQVRLTLEEQRKENLFFGEALVRLGFVTEQKIAETIMQQFGLPFLSPDEYQIVDEALDVFPKDLLKDYQFLPLDKIGERLVIVSAGLMSRDMLDELERIAGQKICQYISTWSLIRNKIEEIFKNREPTEVSMTNVFKLEKETTEIKKTATEIVKEFEQKKEKVKKEVKQEGEGEPDAELKELEDPGINEELKKKMAEAESAMGDMAMEDLDAVFSKNLKSVGDSDSKQKAVAKEGGGKKEIVDIKLEEVSGTSDIDSKTTQVEELEELDKVDEVKDSGPVDPMAETMEGKAVSTDDNSESNNLGRRLSAFSTGTSGSGGAKRPSAFTRPRAFEDPKKKNPDKKK